MLYRLLRLDEHSELGLSAKRPLSDVSVFDHIINGSNHNFDSKYISTFGSLNAMLNFRSTTFNPDAQMVQICEDNLPVDEKIDLRTSEIRSHYYNLDDPQFPNGSINKFNNYAKKLEIVLLVGNVPTTHINLLSEADLVPIRLPT